MPLALPLLLFVGALASGPVLALASARALLRWLLDRLATSGRLLAPGGPTSPA